MCSEGYRCKWCNGVTVPRLMARSNVKYGELIIFNFELVNGLIGQESEMTAPIETGLDTGVKVSSQYEQVVL